MAICCGGRRLFWRHWFSRLAILSYFECLIWRRGYILRRRLCAPCPIYPFHSSVRGRSRPWLTFMVVRAGRTPAVRDAALAEILGLKSWQGRRRYLCFDNLVSYG